MAQENKQDPANTPPKTTIAQPPNKSLIIFALAWVTSIVTEHGPIHKAAYTIFVISGVIWSYQEITNGVNWFRRLLGLLILGGIAASLYRGAFF